MDDVLFKPVDKDVLIEKISEYLNQSKVTSIR